MKNKALFLDRDGVITDFIYDQETGVIHTPFHSKEVKLIFGIDELLKFANEKGYLTIVISNQPGIGLGKLSEENFQKVNGEMKRQLAEKGAHIDHEYYCLHNPYAVIEKYRQVCDCRKPKIGLFQKASQELEIDLSSSWMIGDSPTDIIAGHDAGCHTILLSSFKEGRYLEIVKRELGDIMPDHFVKKLPDTISII
jgi:D-glycero-D-manno-heptose 1,7-bisphosphate phosphatase